MNILKRIEEWEKSGCPYLQGVALYLRLPNRKRQLLKQFQRYLEATPPSRLQSKLKSELLSYRSNSNASVGSESVGKRVGAPIVSTQKGKNYPKSILVLKEKGRRLYMRYDATHGAMAAAKTDGDRYEFAREIMEEIVPKIDEIYGKIRRWEKTGVEPVVGGKSEEDVVKMVVEKMLKINSLKSRISRLRRLLKGDIGDKKRQVYQKEILEKEVEMQELKNELGL